MDSKCKCRNEIIRQYENEKASLSHVCSGHYLRIEFVNDDMYVISRISVWKVIQLSHKRFSLLHQNGYNRRRRAGYRQPLSEIRFHRQSVSSDSLIDLLNYIHRHEEWRADVRMGIQPGKGSYAQLTKSSKRKKQKCGVIELLDQLAICRGDFSESYVVNH